MTIGGGEKRLFPLSASFTGRQHIILVCVCEGRRRKLRVKAASVASSSALNLLAHPKTAQEKPERSFKSEVLGPAAQTPDFTDVSGFYQQLSGHAQIKLIIWIFYIFI